jgi:hypothetical protein
MAELYSSSFVFACLLTGSATFACLRKIGFFCALTEYLIRKKKGALQKKRPLPEIINLINLK